jgi:hypothetical protein
MTPKDLADFVGYCGLYCNACAIRQEKFKTAVNSLRGLITAYGFDKFMPQLAKWEPSFKHYNEFNQVMDGFVKMFGECPGCPKGGGDPNCKVRTCAKRKGYRTCAQCKETETCDHLAPYRRSHLELVDALQNIKQNGAEKYAQQMQKKVDEGFSYQK